MPALTVDAHLPVDQFGVPIQALAPSTVINTDVDGTTDRSVLTTNSDIVEIATTVDVYLLFGDSSVTVSSSTGQFFPKGSVVYRIPAGATHISYIQAATGGRITITTLV